MLLANPDGNGYHLPAFSYQYILIASRYHAQSYNSNGQNPCEIAGWLQASCLGFGEFAFQLL